MFTRLRQSRYSQTRFQLIDDQGVSTAYAGLAFELVDQRGRRHGGRLDASGVGRVRKGVEGPFALMFRQLHDASNGLYSRLMGRTHYPLKITELQVRAERTRFLDRSGARPQSKPPCIDPDSDYYQIEVRHLVEHVSHLPPEAGSLFPVERGPLGVHIAEGRHTVLQVRPLRALCPLLSTDPQFCALNLYQLALMATLGNCSFAGPARMSRVQDPFGEASMMGWRASPEQAKSYYPLYEDVPYSARLEIVPFDPVLYPANDPLCGMAQETPSSVHYRGDIRFGAQGAGAQVFVSHNDKVVLVAVHSTCTWSDLSQDAEAPQVPFEEGEGQVHGGFYDAARQAYELVDRYMDKFHWGQAVLICGHSQGGAIGLILAQMLIQLRACEVQLYTYGAPRAADATFVRAAQGLVHQRMVNHNDPVPGVPGSWMNRPLSACCAGTVLSFVNVPAGFGVFVAGLSRLLAEPYQHHGTLRHFMPLEFAPEMRSHVLWDPLSKTITQHAVSHAVLEQNSAAPESEGGLKPRVDAGQPFMIDSYIPSCWAVLRRSQQALQARCSLVTEREVLFVDQALEHVAQQLRVKYREVMTCAGGTFEEQVEAMNLLMREMSNVHKTRKRLYLLRFRVPTRADVYGQYAQQPGVLAESLERWESHSESTRIDQLAMAPIDELFAGSVPVDHLLA